MKKVTARLMQAKALRNWKISVKALLKRLRKLTIITKQLIAIIIVSFVNNNRLTINKHFLTKIGGNNEFSSPVLLLAKLAIKGWIND